MSIDTISPLRQRMIEDMSAQFRVSRNTNRAKQDAVPSKPAALSSYPRANASVATVTRKFPERHAAPKSP